MKILRLPDKTAVCCVALALLCHATLPVLEAAEYISRSSRGRPTAAALVSSQALGLPEISFRSPDQYHLFVHPLETPGPSTHPIDHIVIPVLGSSGDVLPMLAIAQALQKVRPGLRITIMTNPYFEEEVRLNGFDLAPLGTREQFEEIIKNPEIFGRRAQRQLFELLAAGIEPAYQWINNQPDKDRMVIFANRFVPGAKVASEQWGIPLVIGEVGVSHLWSIYKPPKSAEMFFMPWLWPSARALAYRFIERHVFDRYLAPEVNRLRRENGLGPPVERIFSDYMLSADGLLAMVPEWFAKVQEDYPNIRMTGFPFYDFPRHLSEGTQAFLNEGSEPVVYTAGSANRHAHSFFRSAVVATQEAGGRAIFVGPRDQMPDNLPPNILAVEFEPFAELFTRCKAVVQPAGIGTGAWAMRIGIPQLLVPLAHDQFDNAARFKDLRIAHVLPRSAYQAGLFERQIVSLLKRFEWLWGIARLRQAIERRQENRRGRRIGQALYRLLRDRAVMENVQSVRERMSSKKRGERGAGRAAEEILKIIGHVENPSTSPDALSGPLGISLEVRTRSKNHRFDNKVVFITGGSAGFGRALGIEMARRGAAVVLAARGLNYSLEAVESEIRQAGGRALAIACDVMDELQIRAAMEKTIDVFGQIDVLVLNAGIGMHGNVHEVPRQWIRDMLGVNMAGTVNTAVEGIPHVLVRRGRVVVIGSVMGVWPLPGWALYTAAKHMLVGLVKGLQLELGPHGVSVTHVILPYVDTNFRKRNEEGKPDPTLPDWAPRAMMMSAEEAADTAADGIHSRKREIHFTLYGRVAIWISRLFPWAVQPLARLTAPPPRGPRSAA